MPTNIFDMTDVWNNPAVTFTAVKMNVTFGNGAADSKLIDLQLGGLSKFNVGKTVTYASQMKVGPAGGNFAGIMGTAAGSQGVFYGADPSSADGDINAGLVAQGGGSVLLIARGALQASASGPPATSRYIQLIGAAGADNPRVAAGGGGVVEIDSPNLVGAPTSITPVTTDDSNKIATTGFVKSQKYVQTAGATNFNQLAGFADPPDGTLVQGIDMPPAGLKKIGPTLALSDDLGALEALTGINTIYYRSGLSTWTEVVIGSGLTFTGGTLAVAGGGAIAPSDAEYITATSHGNLTAERVLTNTATITWDFSTPGQAKATSVAGGGNVSNVGTPTNGQFARWTGATTIEGISPATALTALGAQPIDATLTAFAGLANGADQMPYFSGTDAMLTTGLTPFIRTLLDDANAPLAIATLGAAPLDSPNLFGTPTTTTPPGAENSIRIANTAWVKGLGYLTIADVSAGFQPLDGDLTALAALTGTNTIYYRSAANVWTPVTIGANMTFIGGILNVPISGGNVSNSGTPAANELAYWQTSTTIKGVSLATHRTGATFTGLTTFNGGIAGVGAVTISGASITAQTATGTDGVMLSAIGTQARITSVGSAASVPIYLSTHGPAPFFFYTNDFGNPQFAVTHQAAVPGYIQFQGGDSAVNIQMNGGSLGNRINIFNSNLIGTTKLLGVSDASNAAAGDVGEVISNTFLNVAVGATTTINVVSTGALGAGDWEVWAQGHINATTTTTPNLALHDVVAVVPSVGSAPGQTMTQNVPGGTTVAFHTRWRFNRNGTFTVWLNVSSGTNACTWTGAIFARRMR